jgi:hypothetical protein
MKKFRSSAETHAATHAASVHEKPRKIAFLQESGDKSEKRVLGD